jgi:uncharacterized membrane protein YkvA (DUF1232 family)
MDLSSPPSAGTALLVLVGVLLVVLLGIAIFLLVKLLRTFAIVRSDAMPLQGKITFWAALAYTVFPVDVLLDPIYLDDIGVLTGALAYLGHLATKHGIARTPTTAAAETGGGAPAAS